MKTIEQLKNGDCTVITENIYHKTTKEFHGSYSDEFQCVFFAIPDSYKIIGYIQD
jgi:hypothetical protein